MKRIYIVILVLLATGFVRGDAGVTRGQDPLVVNQKTIVLKHRKLKLLPLLSYIDFLK